jgi:hypothetical protein
VSVRTGVLIAVLAAACGGGTDAPDAGPDSTPPDAAPDAGPAACGELASTPMPLPVHAEGDVVGGGADLEAPTSCTVVDTPFAIESAGVDTVLKLGGLVPGNEYGVAVTSDADLAFYVVTGCSTETGPSADECALFVDAALGGEEETGRFVATGATAWLVIDTWTSTPPDDGSFEVDVYAIACDDDANCGGLTPACLAGRCVGCVDSFDCTMPQLPRCETAAHTCVDGDLGCTGDDAAEPYDDGPGGAPLLVLDGSGSGEVQGAICDVPSYEYDVVRFVVANPGETWAFDLTWAGGADLDLYAFDSDGTVLGLSYWERPEQVALTYLAPGNYYLLVDNFAGGTGPAVPYTLGAQRTAGPGCATTADCAAEHRNQIYRGACIAGSCESIRGDGTIGEAAACDSMSDCADGLACSSFFFVADADTRDVCARGCANDADCGALGADYVCTTYLSHNFCVQKCTDDAQCPTFPDEPPSSPPWKQFSCQTSTGRCLP